MNKSKLLNYIGDKIKKWKLFPDLVHILYSCNNAFFDSIHIKTFPQADPIYKTLKHKPKYWTFSFVRFNMYPEDIFLLFSDHDDGVFKRLRDTNRYCVTDGSYCIFGSNKLQKGVFGQCFFEHVGDISYANIDWLTGSMMQNDENIGIANDIINNTGFITIGAKKLFKFVAPSFRSSANLPIMLRDLAEDNLQLIIRCLVENNYSDQSYKDAVLLIPENILNKIMIESCDTKANILVLIENMLIKFMVDVNKKKKLLNKKKAYKKKKKLGVIIEEFKSEMEVVD
jgi:hypothetical protein